MIEDATPSRRVGPFPHVSGFTRRVRAEPTRLNPLAARIMSSSGTFSTARGRRAGTFAAPREAPRLDWGRVLGVVAVLSFGASFYFSGEPRGPMERTVALVSPAPIVDSHQLFSLGVGDHHEPAPRVAPEAAGLDQQDRFEVARLLRLTEAALRDQSARASRAMNLPPNMAYQ